MFQSGVSLTIQSDQLQEEQADLEQQKRALLEKLNQVRSKQVKF